MELYALNEAFYTLQMMNPLSSGQIALWHAIVRIANKSRWQEWFTVASITLVQLSGLSPEGVKKARNELKQRGLIDFKPDKGRATRYKLVDISKSTSVSTPVSTLVSTLVSTPVSTPVSTALNKQDIDDTTPIPPKGDERFDRFWSAYPRKTGKDAARKAFARRKVNDELLQQMLDAIEAQKQSEQWTRNGGQFIPHPATWLNQGRWQDETEPLPFADAPPVRWVTSEDDLYA